MTSYRALSNYDAVNGAETPPQWSRPSRRWAALAMVLMFAGTGAARSQAPQPWGTPGPAGVDPRIGAMLSAVSPARLRATDAKLVAFGTRNLFSETLNQPKRGVYAARDYVARQFRNAAKDSGGRMTVAYDTYVQVKTGETPRAVEVSSVIATLRGDDPARGTLVLSSHYDSRNSEGNDATRDAPGADDNGSGTSAVIEAARVMARAHYKATLVFACFDGEEQGLFGSAHYAKGLKSAGVRVEANLNNDIIGASLGHGGERSPYDVRLFSEALPADANLYRVDLLGSENDSPSRELARAVKESGEAYLPAMHVGLVYRSDRFLRGGDQQSFAAESYPAVRFVERHENFDHQHQTVRTEGGVQYGDLMQYVDFDYLARVTRLNVAALATLASAPAAPVATLNVKRLSYDSTLNWTAVPDAVSYEALWRHSDEPLWSHAQNVGNVTTATLPLSKDDWIFGVRAVDDAGHRSVASYPAPVR